MNNKIVIGLAAAVVVLSIATVSAKAQSFSIREEIVDKAVERIVSLIMGTEIGEQSGEQSLGSSVPREQAKSSTVMVSEGAIATKNSNRTDIGQVDREYQVKGMIYGKIPSSGGNSDSTTAATTDGFFNNSGKTMYVDVPSLTMYTSGTPSTTMDFIFATSTAPFVYNASPSPAIWMYRFATTTAPGLKTGGIINAQDTTVGDGTVSAFKIIPVEDGEYFGMLKKNVYEQGCDGSACESATSTNWGLTGDWSLNYSFFTKSF